jgi:hypothetical protein
MYHTPNLTGLRKKYIPRRINEGWGLQHMKLYGMDDEIILSGYTTSFSFSKLKSETDTSAYTEPTSQATTSPTAKTDTTSSPPKK